MRKRRRKGPQLQGTPAKAKAKARLGESCSVTSDSLRQESMEFSRQEYWWVALPFSRGSSQPRDPTQVFRVAGGFFTS